MRATAVCFEKLSAPAATKVLGQAARWLTESPARTALVGAGVGAAHGALTRGDEGLVPSALRGGLRGAAVGGAVGGAGRAYRDTRLLNPALSGSQAVGATAKRVGEGIKNFGKRQLHGFTGAYSDQAAQIGMRSSGEASRRMELEILRAGEKNRHGGLTDKGLKELVEKHKSLRSMGRSGDAALKAGITNLPGIAKGLATKPVQTAKALGRELIGDGGLQSHAMVFGAPLALAAPDLARGDESAHGGRSMRQKAVGVGSGLVGGALMAGVPAVPQMVGLGAVDAAASHVLGRSKKRLGLAQREAGAEEIANVLSTHHPLRGSSTGGS